MSKNATPDKKRRAEMKRAGINPLLWVVMKDLGQSMIVKHLLTGEFKLINK